MAKNKTPHFSIPYQQLIEWLAVISALFGIFYWDGNLNSSFWLRRFFIIFGGLISLVALIIFHRNTLINVFKNKIIVLVFSLSICFLLIRHSGNLAIWEYLPFHPSILSLLASLFIGLLIATFDIKIIKKTFFYAILGWAVINFFVWLIKYHFSVRLGFFNAQVILAAFLFGLGMILGIGLYGDRQINKKVAIFGLTFLSICLLASQTRSAMIILVIIISTGYWQKFIKYKKPMSLILTGAVATIFIFGPYFGRLHNVPYFVKSVKYRQHLIQASLSWSPKDIVFGSGIPAIETNIEKNAYKYPDLNKSRQALIYFESSHNYLVDLFVERGVIITTLTLIILIKALKRAKSNPVIWQCLAFLSLYLLFNNINLQMELIFWVLIIVSLTLKKQSITLELSNKK